MATKRTLINTGKKSRKMSSDLRERAKKRLARMGEKDLKQWPEDAQKLLQELRVHQIELEMQNEQLREAQIVIEESRSRFADLYDFAPVAYLTFNDQGRVLEANFKAAELLGVTKSELVRTSFLHFTPERFQNIFRSHRRSALQEPGRQVCELKLIRKDGKAIDVLVESQGGKDENGKLTQIRSALWDITERKRREEEIRQLNADLERKVAERTTELRAVNSELLFKATQLEEKFSELQQAQKRLDHLASFPEMNSNPIVEVNDDGSIQYLNPAARKLFTDLEEMGHRHEWLLDLKSVGTLLKEQMGTPYVREIKIDSTWFEQLFFLTPMQDQIRVYSRDITERKRAEEALRTSLERYRSYIEVTGELGWTTNAEGEVVEDIPSFRKFTGQTDEEIKDWGWSKALHPEDFDYTTQIWRQAVQSKTHYEVEYRLRRHDGIYRYFLARGVPVFKDNGDVREWVGTCIDITERKQMEKELRKSRDDLEIRVQERTKEVKEQSRVLDYFFKFSITPFVILDKDFNFIRVNEAYAKVCHRDVSEFFGHNHFEFYPSDAKDKFEQVVQTKEPYVAIGKPFSFPDHPEWGVTYWDWILTPILDDTGGVEYLVFSLEDVTKRKRAEEDIERERRRFYDVLEMLPAYVVLLTPDYLVPFANRVFRERFGESHGKRCFEYLFGRSEACEICETYTVLKTIAPHHWEWTGPDGRIYDVFDFPFTEMDGSTLILEMGIDITERKRAEEALKESEARLRALSSQLLTAQESERKRIALELHDGIGQMLTAIKFKVESLLQEKGTGKARAKEKSFEAIIPMVRESVEEVRRMQMDLRPSTLDDLGVLATLGWFCREYQKIYSHIRIEKEVDLKEDEVSTPLKVVLYRMTQEAMNNVAKHSKADLIHLSLRRRENEIELVIKDNGMGFDLQKILSSEGSKRGLGLASMRERTELSGGKFMIESTQGKGTTIRASWPL